MLNNQKKETKPQRVVLLGGSGFVGNALKSHLEASNIPTLTLSSNTLDLTTPASARQLADILRPEDSLILLAALTPDKGKGIQPFMKNLTMVETVCKSLEFSTCGHLVYFSSDAVYPLETHPVREDSPASPQDLYGIMHRSRELMLQNSVKTPLCILRPTLIYGADDSHNSYGPNRFRRQARKEAKITFGGEGEETRDHIYIDDVVQLTYHVLCRKSVGVLNLATGKSHSFKQVAIAVASHFDYPIELCPTPRNMPVTHRSFDTTLCMQSFPGFVFTTLEQGTKKAHKES
jgi:nucleoside-diphosphate-sugar epimerase